MKSVRKADNRSTGGADSSTPPRRRARDRQATEADLLHAARQLLERDGVLAGLNLREVADLAGVNRGQIYQYFGSRRDLLRAAVSEMAIRRKATFEADQPISFGKWRLEVFRRALGRLTEIRLAALLALDGETELRLFPAQAEALAAAKTSQTAGDLSDQVDATGALVATASAYLGYSIFRDAFAEEFNSDPEALDAAVMQAYQHMVLGLREGGLESWDRNDGR